MANFFDYLDWYGDLTFEQVPFNEVDALLLANLSYVRLANVVPGPGEGSVAVAEAAPAYQAKYGKLTLYATPSFTDPVVELLPQKMAQGKRFAGARLANYVDTLDPATAEQFGAISIALDDGSTYLSFRGTDDTLVGWHENFDMSYEITPAQVDARKYLDGIASTTDGPLMLGGHSKGGNLAVFAAAHASDAARARVVRIWDMDGPGFAQQVIAREPYANVQDRVRLYVPHFDIVGQLLCRQTPTKIVSSSAKGMLQHSATSWEVMGSHLVAVEPQEIDPIALSYSKDFNDWFHDADNATRKRVFNEFFAAAAVARIETLTQLCSGNPRMLMRLLNQILRLDHDAQHYVLTLVTALVGSYASEARIDLGEDIHSLICQMRRSGARAIDPDTPLSADELHEFRKGQARRQTLDDLLAILGDTRAECLRTLAIMGALGIGIGALGVLLAHRGRA